MGPPRLWVPVTLGVALSAWVGAPCLLVLLACGPVHCGPCGGAGKPGCSSPSAASLSSPPSPTCCQISQNCQICKNADSSLLPGPVAQLVWSEGVGWPDLEPRPQMESPSLVRPLGLGERSPWRGGSSE